jgi:hypothetical protein
VFHWWGHRSEFAVTNRQSDSNVDDWSGGLGKWATGQLVGLEMLEFRFDVSEVVRYLIP